MSTQIPHLSHLDGKTTSTSPWQHKEGAQQDVEQEQEDAEDDDCFEDLGLLADAATTAGSEVVRKQERVTGTTQQQPSPPRSDSNRLARVQPPAPGGTTTDKPCSALPAAAAPRCVEVTSGKEGAEARSGADADKESGAELRYDSFNSTGTVVSLPPSHLASSNMKAQSMLATREMERQQRLGLAGKKSDRGGIPADFPSFSTMPNPNEQPVQVAAAAAAAAVTVEAKTSPVTSGKRAADTSDSAKIAKTRRRRAPRGDNESFTCEITGCTNQCNTLYTRRYHTCREHIEQLDVVKDGQHVRFCQRCSSFQPVEMFEGSRHTCRQALETYNAARRKLRQEASSKQAREQAAQAQQQVVEAQPWVVQMRQQAEMAQQQLQQRFKQNQDTTGALPHQEVSDAATLASANQHQLEQLDWELNYWRSINAFAWSYAERMKQASGPKMSASQREAMNMRPASNPQFPPVQQQRDAAVAHPQMTPEQNSILQQRQHSWLQAERMMQASEPKIPTRHHHDGVVGQQQPHQVASDQQQQQHNSFLQHQHSTLQQQQNAFLQKQHSWLQAERMAERMRQHASEPQHFPNVQQQRDAAVALPQMTPKQQQQHSWLHAEHMRQHASEPQQFSPTQQQRDAAVALPQLTPEEHSILQQQHSWLQAEHMMQTPTPEPKIPTMQQPAGGITQQQPQLTPAALRAERSSMLLQQQQQSSNEVARADQELNQLLNTLVKHQHTMKQRHAILNKQSAVMQQPQ